jgi:hypothetical protein
VGAANMYSAEQRVFVSVNTGERIRLISVKGQFRNKCVEGSVPTSSGILKLMKQRQSEVF